MDDLDAIEARLGLKINREQFLPKEDVDAYDIPVYWANKGEGEHMQLAFHEGQYYRVKRSFKANSKAPQPVSYLKSGKS